MSDRILILANNSNGLYSFRRELIKKLSRKYTVVASTPFDMNTDELKLSGCRLIRTEFDSRSMNPVKDIKLLFRYLKILRKVKPVLVISYTIKPNLYGGLACTFLKIPYAANITGLGSAFEGKLKTVISYVYRVALKHARAVLFENSENKALFINKRIIKADKACLMHGAGVNLETFTPAPYPKDDVGFRFLFIGRVMAEKGVNELFAAMERLRAEGLDCTLDMLGGYYEDYREKIEDTEKKGWLHYHGCKNDVRPYIKRSHCFVLPSWHEGMANTNLECAASARPVITSNIAGCREAVIEGVSGFLCEVKNADSLYKEMKKMIALSADDREKMGLAGREHMERVFDKRKVVEESVKAFGLTV